MHGVLAQTFKSLIEKYAGPDASEPRWVKLSAAYSEPGRRYHTLTHLHHMLAHLLPAKQEIRNFDAVLFALYYHDFIYNISAKDNEEKSAEFASNILNELHVPKDTIDSCRQHILATKTHALSESHDTNLFTDADLSILGQDWNSYRTYCEQVRQEYAIYPDTLYKPGRRKVLEHFLAMKSIFKTDRFIKQFENQARLNLAREINDLL
jgi:predicted metal-dependent HD superfamily phosphohydrolase